MKLTKRKLSIIMLAVALVLSLVLLFGINTVKPAEAQGTVTVNGSRVFTAKGAASVGGEEVGSGEDAKYYTTFSFSSDDDNVSYRRNLAYYWFEEVTRGEGDDARTEVNNGTFNMEIGLKSTSFEKFVITFESQQYNKTKDGKSVNYVMFFPATEGKVYALVTTDKDATADDVKDKTELNAGGLYIEFTGKYTEDFSGGYDVRISNKDDGGEVIGDVVTGRLENVGGNYAKNSNSSTTPVYPLIFNTVFGENKESGAKVGMIIYSINGQRFENTNASSNYVTDNTKPVLCLEEDFRYFTLNGKLELDYTVIDVLRETPPSPTIYYYLLEAGQYENADTDYNDGKLFNEVKSSNDVLLEAEKDKYMPSAADLDGTAFAPSYVDNGGNLVKNTDKSKPVADMLIKVYLKISDATSNSETSEVYLDWYIENKEDYLVDVNGSSFLAVANDGRGATYNYDGIKLDDGTVKEWGDTKTPGTILGDYQAKIDELAKNLSAGSSSYMYLPSPESLFSDNATAYTDMKFSVYYYHDSKQSNTNLSSSNLSINITKDSSYVFTIYATDAANNKMYYMDGTEVKEFASSEVWTMFEDADKEGLHDRLPWFTFKVGYKGVEFEETPGMQSTAYVGTSYNSASFKINGISGSYTTKYRLFLFDSAKYYNENNHATFTYQEFIDNMDELFENPLTHVYFEEILQVSENDADYEKYKDYKWSNSSTTFTPQDANSFYYMRAEVKDKQDITDAKTCSLAIVASETSKSLPGESDWLKNNVVSIVLLVIAVVALIGIVLLLVIKPKNKGDVDVQLEKAKKKEKKSK